jgi:hypothetical protein
VTTDELSHLALYETEMQAHRSHGLALMIDALEDEHTHHSTLSGLLDAVDAFATSPPTNWSTR